VKRMSNPKLH